MTLHEEFEALFRGEMEADEGRKLLSRLYERGESAQEIAEVAEVMRSHAIELPVSEDLRDELIDNCGTGGDQSGTFNISTTASLLLAACGLYVAKHGNRSITSKSGSADMLEALGLRLDHEPLSIVRMIEDTGFGFLFAQRFHPAMKHIMPIRKSLPHRTIFNILGPLTNPARPKRQLIGVFSADFAPKMAEAMRLAGAKSVLVVSSADGLDEISIAAPTFGSMLHEGGIDEIEMTPEDAKLPYAPLSMLTGGDSVYNAKIAWEILAGQITDGRRDVVVLNAAAALQVAGRASSLAEGAEIALEAIQTGRAKERLKKIIDVSEKL
ncbi:MAG: anthranilate phosphoribosyltransferase [Campylobacterales bacterium]